MSNTSLYTVRVGVEYRSEVRELITGSFDRLSVDLVDEMEDGEHGYFEVEVGGEYEDVLMFESGFASRYDAVVFAGGIDSV